MPNAGTTSQRYAGAHKSEVEHIHVGQDFRALPVADAPFLRLLPDMRETERRTCRARQDDARNSMRTNTFTISMIVLYYL